MAPVGTTTRYLAHASLTGAWTKRPLICLVCSPAHPIAYSESHRLAQAQIWRQTAPSSPIHRNGFNRSFIGHLHIHPLPEEQLPCVNRLSPCGMSTSRWTSIRRTSLPSPRSAPSPKDHRTILRSPATLRVRLWMAKPITVSGLTCRGLATSTPSSSSENNQFNSRSPALSSKPCRTSRKDSSQLWLIHQWSTYPLKFM